MKKVQIEYFAILRDQRGLSTERYETNAPDAQQLFTELQNKFHFSLPTELLKVAINDSFADWTTAIKNDDRIVFIPPVAGG